jgi:hypothetical protein
VSEQPGANFQFFGALALAARGISIIQITGTKSGAGRALNGLVRPAAQLHGYEL